MLLLAALLGAGAPGPAGAQVPDCPPVEPGIDLPGEPAEDGGAPSILVVIPKDATGAVGTAGLELGPGAEIVESRFSPLLCATVARVSGAAGASPASLVVRLPEGAAAVPDDAYAPEAEPEPEHEPEPETKPVAGAPPDPKPDPYRKQQWALDALGADAAQRVTLGENARVAVLDTRANDAHADLALRVAGAAQARAGQHGTLVAGIIGAVRGNGAGIVGLAPRAALVSIPVCEATPRGDLCRLYDVVNGLDLAWGERAQIVNLSLVGPPNRVLERAVRRLDTLGVAVVAAAGNRRGTTPAYPGAYPWVIGVAATDRGGRLAPSGPVVDLTAPGVEIVSTSANGGFAFASGSSLAAAHVSGVLALLTSASEGDVASARRALFGAARRANAGAPPALAPLCDALAKLGKTCD
ncbi:MAG TPA: S8 family serine peptidase [Myxococcota bacterium]|nr:S8 family serine peptidase [Myxococcota bacterium]